MKVVLVDKLGVCKVITLDTVDNLYKKCGYKILGTFKKHHTWDITKNKVNYKISVYGKDTGRAGSENKYELPPPIDTTLFFGKIAIVLEDKDLDLDLWNNLYEHLFGGFEDLDNSNSDDDEDDELDEYPDEMKTKQGGYLKDGFVVSDGELEEEDYIFSDEEN